MTKLLLGICFWALFLLMLDGRTNAADELWGPVNPAAWKSVPCVTARPATEQDVKDGRAAFYLSGPPGGVRAIMISLPHCAIWHDKEHHRDVPVVCIQAEDYGKAKAVGFRFLTGGNGVCLLSELDLLDEPNEMFTRLQ